MNRPHDLEDHFRPGDEELMDERLRPGDEELVDERICRGDEQLLGERFRSGREVYVPHVTTDCVIFGFHAGELKVLLLKWKHLGKWSLPGGPVQRSQSVDAAAHTVLHERTGLADVFLQQFHTFGGNDRGEEVLLTVFRKMNIDPAGLAWLAERAVSIGYYALVDFSETIPKPDVFSDECRWWDLRERPPLLFDHDQMVERALDTLRRQLTYQPVGLSLLPEKFTMPELQQLYETVLGHPLDRRNFNRKMKDLGVVERLSERRTGVAHRAPYLYRFHHERYKQALSDGLAAGF